MAFCVHCGNRLAEGVLFCTECGAPVAAPAAAEQPTQVTTEVENDIIEENPAPEVSEEFHQPSPAPQEQILSEAEASATVSKLKLGYSSAVGGTPPASKMSGGKIAIIIISSVVLVTLIAAIFMMALRDKSPDFLGYWTTASLDLGDGNFLPEIYGKSVEGLMRVQVEEDGTIFIATSQSSTITATWKAVDGGFAARVSGKAYLFTYDSRADSITVGEDAMRYLLKRGQGDLSVSQEPGATQAPTQGPTGMSEVSGYVGNGKHHVNIVGAEKFEDSDGDPAIRFYYEFTNEETFSISSWDALDFEVEQDGEDLEYTYSWEEIGTDGNVYLNVRPGVTLQCSYQTKYNPQGGKIHFRVFGYEAEEEGGQVIADFNPDKLPGAPAPFIPEKLDEPQWTLQLPSAGAIDDYYAKVTNAEILYVEDYGDCVRIYYSFTNNSDDKISLAKALVPLSYQDGIELKSIVAYFTDSDEMFDAEVEPGQTVEASYVFILRNSNSPIEAELESMHSYNAVGETYKAS